MFRLMTYNILEGGAGRESLVFETITANQPDVVLLQEVDNPAFFESLASRLGMHSFLAEAPVQLLRSNGKLKPTRRSIGLLSRFPIIKKNNYRVFPIWRTLLEATIEYAPGQQLTLFGLHLKAALTWVSELYRVQEVKTILRRIESLQPEKYLIAGDFNTLRPGDPILNKNIPFRMKMLIWLQFGRVYRLALPKVVKANLTDCYRTLHPTEPGFTLPPPVPNTRLDYIFASPGLVPFLRTCEVVTAPSAVLRASDHYPVIADFEIPVVQ
jgi:endonuclease/exonuclease/phosphatase family metal-dependent hydrolase